jgi:galactofuranose transport system substrate-binding protein
MTRQSRKNRVLLILALLFGLVTVACSNGLMSGHNKDQEAPVIVKRKVTGHTDSTMGKPITIGFVQVGAEGGWRVANTKSIKDSAEEYKINLQFVDAELNQEVQIQAIRQYIVQKVDVIAFSPVVEYGWDDVLLEAKAAGIPVILTDRAIDSKDSSLYVTYLGSDFAEEGRKAGRWLMQEMKNRQGPVNIVELQGTKGSAPAIDRKKGFEEIISNNKDMRIMRSEVADFTKETGKRTMRQILSEMQMSNTKIDVLYAHNDDMALGAVEAIEEAGLIPGKDILIISIDGIKDALQAVAANKINMVIECNPMLGPQLMQAAMNIVEGKSLPKRMVTKERVFTRDSAKKELPYRKY